MRTFCLSLTQHQHVTTDAIGMSTSTHIFTHTTTPPHAVILIKSPLVQRYAPETPPGHLCQKSNMTLFIPFVFLPLNVTVFFITSPLYFPFTIK